MFCRSRLPHLSALALATALTAASPARADDSFQFLQTGYADGASISGSFSGSDVDGDGWVLLDELSAFTLQFSGNHVMAGFTHDLGALTDFRFGSGIGRFGPEPLELHIQSMAIEGERITSYGSRGWPLPFGEGAVMELPSFVLSGTGDALQVSAVPEPAAPVLLLAGLALLGWLQRRRPAGLSARWGS